VGTDPPAAIYVQETMRVQNMPVRLLPARQKQGQHVYTYLLSVATVEATIQLLLGSALGYDRPDDA
jgi:hypothetical protein